MSGWSTSRPGASGHRRCSPSPPARSSPPDGARRLCTACVHPLLAHPVAEVIGQVSQVMLSLADGLGVTAEHGGDVFGASVPELGDFDGGVAASVLLGERVVERAHRLFDLGAIGHGGITTGPALWSIPWLYRLTRQVGKLLNLQSLYRFSGRASSEGRRKTGAE